MRNKSIKENYDETERIQSSVGQGYHSSTANIFFDSPKNVRIALNSPRDIIYDLIIRIEIIYEFGLFHHLKSSFAGHHPKSSVHRCTRT